MNESLRNELLRMSQDDLDLRAKLSSDGSLFNGYAAPMAALHRQHNARLRAILLEHGWPGRTLVGEDGTAAAWLVLQHAILDPDLVRDALPMVERAAQAGETERRFVAFLVDRISTLEGRAQTYGTQHDWDASGVLCPLPIAEPTLVDERRRSMGLESLAENTRRLRAQAAAEGERPPANHAEREREGAAWARSVGWRK